jgi:hypothetical protein
MKKSLFVLIGSLLVACMARSQESVTHDHSLALNFQQIKESLNYGLVFRGPGLGYAYSAQWQNNKRVMDYEGRISFNVPITKGIIAASLNVVPARFGYFFKTTPDGQFSIGPYAIMEYNYEIYPDLQSGYSYWFTHYSLGCAMACWFKPDESRIDLSLHFTILGLTSRTETYDDPYFFDAGFGAMIKDLHSDLQFGSLGKYAVSELEVKWTPKETSRLAWAYVFQYYGYGYEPELTILNHSVKLIILPKKNK